MSQEAKIITTEVVETERDMTAAEFEAAMVEADPLIAKPSSLEDTSRPDIGSPGDIAAAMFQKHAVRLKQSLNYMGKKELIRIILHATLHPLFENRKIIKSNDEALVAYDIKELIRCMMIMEIEAANESRSDGSEQREDEARPEEKTSDTPVERVEDEQK